MEDALFRAGAPAPALPDHKVTVTGYRNGVILHLTKDHAEAIAKRINDEDRELHGYDTYNCERLQSKATVSPMRDVRPRIIAGGKGFTIIDNEFFLKNHLDEVVGENCEFPETK